LLWNLLRKDPLERLTPEQALKHPFFQKSDIKKFLDGDASAAKLDIINEEPEHEDAVV
jgi:serine/threonine protein kinase